MERRIVSYAYGKVSKKDSDTAAIKSEAELVIPHAPRPGS